MVKYLFVYGTLKQGYGLNGYIRGDLVGTFKVKGFDMYTNGYFPMIKKGSGTITGELYKIEDEVFKDIIPQLDSIECAYDRIEIEVNGVIAYTYLYKYSVNYLTKINGIF